VKIGNLDSSKKVIIVAEIGNNHEGCFQLAKKLVDKAAETGVDAVKFQTFQTKTFVAPSQADRYQRMLGFELAQEQFAELAERAQSNGLKFISSPLDLPSAAFLSHIADAIKIASGDNTFYPLIKFVAGTKKPVIISTGFSDQAKIDATVSLFRMTRKSSKPTNDFALLHCVSAYPVEIADANLGAIAALSRKYGCNSTIGYSDHTLGITAATLAVAGGARIIEKHFTIDRHHSHFRDHQLSADPKMMKELVKNIRESETYLGSGIIGPRQIEIDTELPVRRSIAASNNLVEGHKVTKDDIMWIRPGHGYAPGQEKKVVGKKLKTSIQMGELFSKEHFQE
tara:strand:+ start:720 stop:1739 length:1020 start_codon:yes stop_codon:yes gene_type:complete